MTQVKMNQTHAIELDDAQLNMVAGGKGRPGGSSPVRELIRLIRRIIEKNPPNDG